MTIEEIKTRIEEIRKLAKSGDFETAHVRESTLFIDVLIAIAQNKHCDPAKLLAANALQSLRIEFTRVMA